MYTSSYIVKHHVASNPRQSVHCQSFQDRETTIGLAKNVVVLIYLIRTKMSLDKHCKSKTTKTIHYLLRQSLILFHSLTMVVAILRGSWLKSVPLPGTEIFKMT